MVRIRGDTDEDRLTLSSLERSLEGANKVKVAV